MPCHMGRIAFTFTVTAVSNFRSFGMGLPLSSFRWSCSLSPLLGQKNPFLFLNFRAHRSRGHLNVDFLFRHRIAQGQCDGLVAG